MATTVTPTYLGQFTRGSDLSFNLTLDIDLSGRSIALLDVSRGIAGRVVAEITDPVDGKAVVRVEGTDPIAVGRHEFRTQFNLPDGGDIDSLALPVFFFEVV